MDKSEKTDEEGPMLELDVTEGTKLQNGTTTSPVAATIIKHSYKAVFAQSLVAGAVFLLTAGCGMPIGFSAILLPQIQSQNSTLPTSEETGSWIASIHSVATPVGSLLSGTFMDHWGRRAALRFCVLPLVAGWACMAWAQGHVAIFAGRILAGFAVGLAAAPSQVLLGEVAEPHVRGVIVGAPYVSYSLGILLVYALGSTLPWRTVAALAAVLPLCSLLCFCFLPESPHWLARKGRHGEAQKKLTWLRGGNAAVARTELAILAARQEKENQQDNKKVRSRWSSWKDSPVFSPSVLKPLLIVNIFNILQILSGTFTIIFYAVSVIENAAGIDDTTAVEEEETNNELGVAVLTALVRTLVTALACGLFLMIGRRPLAITSGIGSASAALLLGTWLYILPTPSPAPWLPEAAIMTYVAFNTLGFFILPGLMLGEMLPARARGQAGGVTFTVINVTLFITTKLYPSFAHALKPYGVFWFFGVFTLLATLFVYLFIPETRGKTLHEIEDYFMDSNIMWITRRKEKKNIVHDVSV